MSTELTAEQTLHRHCRAVVAGDMALALGDLTPEVAAGVAQAGVQMPANLQRYEVVDHRQEADIHYFTVTYIGDTQLRLRSSWQNIGGVWKVASVAIA